MLVGAQSASGGVTLQPLFPMGHWHLVSLGEGVVI